jgi:hypothetical protein
MNEVEIRVQTGRTFQENWDSERDTLLVMTMMMMMMVVVVVIFT